MAVEKQEAAVGGFAILSESSLLQPRRVQPNGAFLTIKRACALDLHLVHIVRAMQVSAKADRKPQTARHGSPRRTVPHQQMPAIASKPGKLAVSSNEHQCCAYHCISIM